VIHGLPIPTPFAVGLSLCEVVGHLDLLAERGEVHEVERGGVVRFEHA
jgi:hypothetical protein